jgi:hypothetical protein
MQTLRQTTQNGEPGVRYFCSLRTHTRGAPRRGPPRSAYTHHKKYGYCANPRTKPRKTLTHTRTHQLFRRESKKQHSCCCCCVGCWMRQPAPRLLPGPGSHRRRHSNHDTTSSYSRVHSRLRRHRAQEVRFFAVTQLIDGSRVITLKIRLNSWCGLSLSLGSSLGARSERRGAAGGIRRGDGRFLHVSRRAGWRRRRA